MRTTFSMLAAAAMLLLSGCQDTKWSILRNRNETPRPLAAGETPTAANLVNYLNQNSEKIQSIQCMEMDLDCKQGSQPIGLRAKMCCEKPRNFRLTAEVLAHSEVDLGSNNQEFWYWIGKSDPPYQFHCSYQDLAQGGVRMPFPFQPDWVLEALGMGTYGPAEQYRLVTKPQTFELVQDTVNSQGQRVRKVVVLKRNTGQVQAHVLQDATSGKEICSATIIDVQNVGGAVLPRRMKLTWPDQQLQMTMKLEEVTINQPRGGAELFVRRPLANVQSYDLKRGLDGAGGGQQLQQAGAYGAR